MEKTAALWLLFAGLNFALAKDIPEYFMKGGKLTLELRPPSSEPINYILWKFEGNLLGEWVKGVVDLTYYSTFQGRTTLDTNTGRLEISNMTKADVGVYSVEINNKLQPDQYKAVLIKAVTQPKVVIRPLICGSTPERCTATCEANTTDAGPVTYSWKMGDEEWKQSDEIIDITKADTADVKTFTCRVKNPLDEKESERENNPLFGKDTPDGLGAGGIAGIIVVLIGAAAAATGVAWHQKKGPFKNRGSPNTDNAAENGQTLNKVTPDEDTAAENRESPKVTPDEALAAEKVPLKSPEAPSADGN
ncbi:carcinoembryonic antigen-related cell adhesion molecule 1-like [Epinephelus moara]|uniref:carcinoembryonic antigen-related cell adhesion molecule 1-like n=1 Tax=Epinephelus moara TaxID=300413 RepID=UPI00214F1399|nr:carcinoembryonic antigen-related cell adhesion molecule 1-like [Epinephelus moara]